MEASTDLVNWTRLGPATNLQGRVEFIDPDAGGRMLRFYRVVEIN